MQSGPKQGRNLVTNAFLISAVFCLSLAGLGYANQAQSQMLRPAQTPKWLITNKPEVPVDAASPTDAACDEESQQVLTPTLSTAYLLEPPTKVGKPQLVVGYYNLSEGLLAGYQSASGKRILLSATWRANGAASAEATHLNPATGRIEELMGPSKRIDAATGRRAKVFELAGVDLLSYLKKAGPQGTGPGDGVDRVRQFVDSDAGHAFFEAVPALYAALEPLENDPKLVKLQSPFGAILTALQLNTGIFSGFDHADAVLGVARAQNFRDGCRGQQCRYRGAHFTVQNSGLFDVLSKSKAVAGKKSLRCSSSPPPRSALQTLLKNGDGTCTEPGDCFGYCGPGCFTPGDIETPACAGHDLCVCRWGDAACVFSVPDDCDGCDDLVDAIWSWLEALLDELFSDDY